MIFVAPIDAPSVHTVGAASTTSASDYVIATGAAGVAAASAGACINSAVLGSPLAFVYHAGVTLVAGAYSVSTFFAGESDDSPAPKTTDAPATPVAPKSDAPAPAGA